VGEVTYAGKWVPTQNPELQSDSKSDTGTFRLRQTCHSTYCKSMYHLNGFWRLKSSTV